jgi:hypothetical protein
MSLQDVGVIFDLNHVSEIGRLLVKINHKNISPNQNEIIHQTHGKHKL